MRNKNSKTKNYATMFIVVAFSFAAQTNFDRKIYKKQSRWKGVHFPALKLKGFWPEIIFIQLLQFIYLFSGSRENWNIRLCHAVNDECTWRLKSFQYCVNNTAQIQSYTHLYSADEQLFVLITCPSPWGKKWDKVWMVIHKEC